jgi:hypothetical protein
MTSGGSKSQGFRFYSSLATAFRAVSFLLHFPYSIRTCIRHEPPALRGTPPCGVRTFLPPSLQEIEPATVSAGLMLALRWPSGHWSLDAGFWTLVPSDAGCHRHWSLSALVVFGSRLYDLLASVNLASLLCNVIKLIPKEKFNDTSILIVTHVALNILTNLLTSIYFY